MEGVCGICWGIFVVRLLQQLSEDTRLMREHDPSVTELC